MLPSMPIIFTRESQDALDNQIKLGTNIYNQNQFAKSAVVSKDSSQNVSQPTSKITELIKNRTEEIGCVKKDDKTSNKEEFLLEAALVKSYFTKIRSRFASHQAVPTSKCVQFCNILKSFDPNRETPVELYRRIKELFGEEHKDILEEFLIFLTSDQAAELGRFMDHLLYSQMTNFVEMLHHTFARKPTVLRKVLRSLTSSINTGNSETMKTRVMPHLRSHPRLVQSFKSLFPDERPPDSLYKNGTDLINESFLTDDKGIDIWEFDDETENPQKLEDKGGIDTVYVHGRVFLQHGRMLRTACVTYPYSKEPYRVHARRLAPSHCRLSPTTSDEESQSKDRKTTEVTCKRTRKKAKPLSKNVKDFNDNNKIKDTITNSPKCNKSKTQNYIRNKKENVKDNKDDDSKKELDSQKEADIVGIKRDNKLKRNLEVLSDNEDVRKPKLANIEVAMEHTKEYMPKDTNKCHITILKSIEPKKETKDINYILKKKKEAFTLKSKTIEIKRGNEWTREEDKTMLQILKDDSGSEQIFVKISELLPHRSTIEIKERFCHVMNLLQKMAIGEIT